MKLIIPRERHGYGSEDLKKNFVTIQDGVTVVETKVNSLESTVSGLNLGAIQDEVKAVDTKVSNIESTVSGLQKIVKLIQTNNDLEEEIILLDKDLSEIKDLLNSLKTVTNNRLSALESRKQNWFTRLLKKIF